jgi:hypothetical protein
MDSKLVGIAIALALILVIAWAHQHGAAGALHRSGTLLL